MTLASLPVLRAVLVGLVAVVIGGCDMPHDNAGTMEKIRGGTLRAGAVQSPPWVETQDGAMAGVEVELVSRWADDVGAADIQWSTGSESSLLTALERRELDIVVGGLTARTPWVARVALTQPYLESAIGLGVPPDSGPAPASWAGERIGYPSGELAIAALIRDRDAIPVPVTGPEAIPTAAPRWQLMAWGLELTEHDLHRRRHVMAVPPGENALLLHLDRFLADQRPGLLRRLQETASQGE